VPSFVLYYVDKGRLYFEQLGMQRWSQPIEKMLDADAVDVLLASLTDLERDGTTVRAELGERTTVMGEQVRQQFAEGVGA
jgi:hypothetical protein